MNQIIIEAMKIGGPIIIIVGTFLYFIYRIVCYILIPLVNKMSDSIVANTKVTIEMHDYLKLKNGNMERQMNKLNKKLNRIK